MSNWNPYAPDHNPPPGIPKGYPYALNPNPPNANPMYPMGSPGYPMQNSSPGYPNIGTSPAFYPAGNVSPYPPMSSSTPYPGGSPYPSNSSPYPAGASPYSTAGASPYSTAGASPYPAGASPYPTGASPYPAGSPHPTGSSPYHAGASPYPAGTSTYPEGSSPYPPETSPYPPGSSPHLSRTSPYAPGSYPGGASPYAAGASPYPNNGSQASQIYPAAKQFSMANYLGDGTVKPYAGFDPKLDAEVLRKAMKGFGTDEKSIIKVLANRDNGQRVYIAVAFKQLYGKDLISDLKNELSGNFEQVILGLMMPTSDYLATELHKAISGIGTDENVLIEVLCSRTNHEIWGINEAYSRLYGKALESDIKGDTSGHFQRLLVSTVTGARSEDPADSMRAKQTAEALYQAGAAQWGTDESVFNSILVAESLQQLAHTFYEYQKLTGKTVVQAIEGEMSGDLKQGMLTIAKCVENRPFFFAEKLYKAMKGLGTDDNTLIRIVVSRCEIDMVQIKAEYERNYGKPLGDAIADDTSGDYKKVLLALVNPN